MRFIVTLLLSYLLVVPFCSGAITLDRLNQELKEAESNKNLPGQADVVEALRNAIVWQNEQQEAVARAEGFQKTIDDFPKLIAELRKKLDQRPTPQTIPKNLSTAEYEQLISQSSSKLRELSHESQQEQTVSKEINDSLSQLPRLQSEAKKALTDTEQRLSNLPTPALTLLAQAQLAQLQSELAARKARLNALDLELLSASNRQELSRLRTEWLKQQYELADSGQQKLYSNLNAQRQREAELALEQSMLVAKKNDNLPNSIRRQLQINQELSVALNRQASRMGEISTQQRKMASEILQVRQALTNIREQAQWLNISSVLGESLRAQVAKLPEMPKPQQLDSEMVEIQLQQLSFEAQLESLRRTPPTYSQDNGEPLTSSQQELVNQQIKTERELLNSLLNGSATLILELTKLKVANNQLVDALQEVKDAAHRYLFWISDIPVVDFEFPFAVVSDLNELLSLDTFSELSNATVMMFTQTKTLVAILTALLLIILSVGSRRHYNDFLARAATRVGKVTQDHFSLTLRTLFWSILVSLPIPAMWAMLGYGLQHAWPYPIAVAIGNGVNATLPLLWVFMLSASFARPKGLFLAHFRWSSVHVSRVMRYYQLSIWLIVPLIMALISFEYYNDREFFATLGRLCFLLLCVAVLVLTASLRRAGTPLYLDKNGSGDNLINSALWRLLLSAPIASAVAALLGYLSTAQALLVRLEFSVAVWLGLLVIYHIVRRWMLIQRRKIAFDRAKQRRADMLAQRARSGDENNSTSSSESPIEIEEPIVDLDAISAQSLRLARSFLTLIALISLILIWSEIHSAFSFLENVRLWDVSTTVNGGEVLQPITLGTLLIAILVLLITMHLVRNLPALLELVLLQHLSLSPGTGYALTTLTKYIIMLIGILLGFSLIGFEWAKLQWLVAALTVGLGFGLQEIFGNFISGLIILFEKPIRIGDTVTIRNLTGTITKINTRATTLSDWDRKEIIVPNKAFITEQFTNWSLSDPVTRVVLTVPAPAEANSQEVTQLLLHAAKNSSLVLDNPAAEAYLIDIQQGIQIFELRVYASEMGHRMPMRHELYQNILAGFQQHSLTLPFPPFQVRTDTLVRTRNSIVKSPPTAGSI